MTDKVTLEVFALELYSLDPTSETTFSLVLSLLHPPSFFPVFSPPPPPPPPLPPSLVDCPGNLKIPFLYYINQINSCLLPHCCSKETRPMKMPYKATVTQESLPPPITYQRLQTGCNLQLHFLWFSSFLF